jgi:hypothetical protein
MDRDEFIAQGGVVPGEVLGKEVDISGESGIISTASNAHPRDEELENTIKRCIKQDKPVFADDLAPYFEKIKPETGKYITALHGNSEEAFLYGKGINAKTLANIIRSRKDYSNEEIVLISCNTGNSDNVKKCFAQQLADEIGVTVHAPTRYGIITSSGEYYSGNLKKKHEGEIKPFTPNGKE